MAENAYFQPQDECPEPGACRRPRREQCSQELALVSLENT